jgi:hypothetical protein
MTSYERSPDYVVGLRPTNKAGDILVLNDHDIVDLLKAAVKREGSQSAFAMRYNVNRTELNFDFERQKAHQCVYCKSSWTSQGVCRRARGVRRLAKPLALSLTELAYAPTC